MSSSPTPTYSSFNNQNGVGEEDVAVTAGEEYGLLQLHAQPYGGGGVGHIVGSEDRNSQLQIAAKVAILFLGISLAAITVVAIQSYPAATSEFFSVYGSVAGLSLVFLAMLGVKKQRSFPKPDQTATT